MSPIDTAPIDAAAARSELIARALAKATEAHAGQIRNGSGGLPYIEHPRMVAATLAERDYPDETLAAALLHDVVEDSDTTVEELRAEFGDEIADLVATLSDDESIEDYRDRKDEHRARVAAVDGDACAIYAADKLANMTTLHAAIDDRRHQGRRRVRRAARPEARSLGSRRRDAAPRGAGAAAARPAGRPRSAVSRRI